MTKSTINSWIYQTNVKQILATWTNSWILEKKKVQQILESRTKSRTETLIFSKTYNL